MIVRLIEFVAYTGTIAALFAVSISIFTFLFLGSAINHYLILLILCGTLVIYNLDHLKDINSDKSTNPKRVKFISENKLLIYFITGSSAFLSVLSVYMIGLQLIPLILLPFLFGLMHRIIKNSPLFSAFYITLSWLMITVYLPAYLTDNPKEVITLSVVIGIFLFCNAYTSSIRRKPYAEKYARYMLYLSVINLVIILVLRGSYLGIIPAALFTTMALTNFIDDENYELILLDGMQLLGTVFSIFFLILIKL